MENPFKKYEGKPYMPSNGTEGMMFTDEYCDNCKFQHPDISKTPQCNDILLKALLGEQLDEWVYNSLGHPTCTKFISWNWGDDNEGYNEPPPPEPFDPDQPCLPFSITDILSSLEGVVVTKRVIIEKELVLN